MDAAKDDSRSFATQPKGLGPSDEVLTQESGKMMFLVSLLDNLKVEGHRSLVFSQSRKMLDIIQQVITNKVGRGIAVHVSVSFVFFNQSVATQLRKIKWIQRMFKLFFSCRFVSSFILFFFDKGTKFDAPQSFSMLPVLVVK